MGRKLAGIVLLLIALWVVGAVAIGLLKTLIALVWYLVIGALVVGGAVYLYQRARRSVGSGTRAQRRLEAAVRTYRTRNR